MPGPRLTAQAHAAVAGVLGPGARAVDATVGNGLDTLFMARLVQPGGCVFGFDIQPGALDAARTRLGAAGLAGVTRLVLAGHEQMRERLPPDWPGKVSAIMFNLGYLPGGDTSLVTRAETTCRALDQALQILCVGGLVSLLVYRGHRGADLETGAVRHWLAGLPHGYSVDSRASAGPLLHLIRRDR